MGRVSGILRRNKIVKIEHLFVFMFILCLYHFVFINCFPPMNHRGSGPVILLAQQESMYVSSTFLPPRTEVCTRRS